MKRQLAIWATIGFLISIFWAAYASVFPVYRGSMSPVTGTLLAGTFPVAFASLRLGFPLQLVWAVLINVATYGLVGTFFAGLRRKMYPVH